MISFKGRHTPKSIILQCVRWYCAYSLSYRNIEAMMAERGIKVEHSTPNRWVVHYAQKLENAFHKKKKLLGDRWLLDETYIKVKGEWKCYYRAVDKQGNTIDFSSPLSVTPRRLYVYSIKLSVEMESLA